MTFLNIIYFQLLIRKKPSGATSAVFCIVDRAKFANNTKFQKCELKLIKNQLKNCF